MINVGAGNIQAIKVGAEDAIKAYQGSTLVWTAGGPVYTALTCEYLVTTTGETKIGGTIANYCTGMTVDGVDVAAANTYVFETPGKHIVVWNVDQGGYSNLDSPIDAFNSTYTLKVVHLPSFTAHIGQSAFYHCTGMTECDMSGTAIWGLNGQAFSRCVSLKEIKLPPCTRLNGHTFDECLGVTSVTFTDALTTIGDYDFYRLGENVTANPLEIDIPSGVTSIGEAAFAYSKIDYVHLPEGLQTIGPMAFFALYAPDITIPASVTSLGNSSLGTFNGSGIWFEGSVPPFSPGPYEDQNPFYPLSSHIAIKVPRGSLAAYQAACPMYASQMEEY